MSAWKQKKRVLTFAFVFVFLVCCVPCNFFLTAHAAVAPDGYMYYNGNVLPSLPDDMDDYPCKVMYRINSSGKTFVYGFDKPVYCWVSDNGRLYLEKKSTTYCIYYSLEQGDVSWTLGRSRYSFTSYNVGVAYEFLWCSEDLYDKDGKLSFAGMSESMYSGFVNSISLSRTSAFMERGSDYPVAIDVSGSGEFDSACTCVVSGNTSTNTYIYLDESLPYDSPNTFHLVIGTDETAEELTIVATSVQNPSVSATHTVSLVDPVIPDESVPDTPEGEEPIPTEDNPTEPGDISGGDSGIDSEKDEVVGEGSTSVDDLTEVIPDYSEGFIQALQNFAGAMSYTGTEAKLKIPAVMFPQLGDLVPGFQMMDEVELDFEMYVDMMPDNLMTLVRALFTVALIVYCFKEFYGLVAYALTLKGGIA